jgi:hypothetical protein
MAVTHPTDVRNDISDLVVDKIDAGGAGTIVFQDGSQSDSDIATLTFSATAFGGAANGIATAAAITDDTDCNAGTVSKFTVFSGAGDSCFTGSVTATGGGGDIILSSTAIGQGDTISISSLTYEAPN